MTKTPFIILGIVIVLVAAVVFYHQQTSIIGDEKILTEVQRVQNLATDNIVHVSDLANLRDATAKDTIAQSYLDEAQWLIERDEIEHATHSLYYLSEYVRTGKNEVCVAHELTHTLVYMRHNEAGLIQAQYEEAHNHLDEWRTRVSRTYQKFPQYYPKYNELQSTIDKAIVRLGNKQYDNETLALLTFIQDNEVC